MHTRILEKNWSNTSRALIIVMLCCASALAQEAQVYVSSQAGDRLTAKPAARFAAGAPGPQALKFEINGQVTYRKITGFGASFMEAGLMVINTLSQQLQDEVLSAMFDPQK